MLHEDAVEVRFCFRVFLFNLSIDESFEAIQLNDSFSFAHFFLH